MIPHLETDNPVLNSSAPSAAYMRQWIGFPLVQLMACRLFGPKPLSEPVLAYYQFDPWEKNFSEISLKILYSRKCIWKDRLRNGGHIVQGEMGKGLVPYPHSVWWRGLSCRLLVLNLPSPLSVLMLSARLSILLSQLGCRVSERWRSTECPIYILPLKFHIQITFYKKNTLQIA